MKDINTKGSIWRKWDLHIHSNASDGTGSPCEIVDEAIKNGLEVIAITDHHNVNNVDEIKRIGRNKGLEVVSGIEFRTEYGKQSVHMIGLFPDRYLKTVLNEKALCDLILAPLGLSQTFITQKGKEVDSSLSDDKAFKTGLLRVQVDFKTASDLIHKYGGIVTVHAGSKTSSVEEMKHDGMGETNVQNLADSLGPVKEDLLENYIDICEVAKANESKFYLDAFNKPSIVASDAHPFANIGCKYVWIKGDASFEGLKQIIYEPKERVRIQETIPEEKSDYQVISSIGIEHNDFNKQIIPFNANMNVIIGGRSSGKSILLGCIAKLANYDKPIKEGNDDYNNYIDSLLPSMQLNWCDNMETKNRKVEYFPQSYINHLASTSSDIKTLIEDILKKDEEKKGAFEKYNNDISKNKIQISNAIEVFYKLKYRISEIIKEIKTIGVKDGVKKEILKVQDEINKIKSKISSEITKDEEKDFVEKQNIISKKDTDIKAIEDEMKRLKILEKVDLLKDISPELVGFNDILKDELQKKYVELATNFKIKWEEILENYINVSDSVITQTKEQKKNILIDKIFNKCKTYYETNQVYVDLDKRVKIEIEKLKKIEILEKEIDSIYKEMSSTKVKILDYQKNYTQMGNDLCGVMLLDKDDVKIVPKLIFAHKKFIDAIEDRFNKRSTEINKILSYSFIDDTSFYNEISNIFDGLLNDRYTLKSSYNQKQVVLDILSDMFYDVRYNVEYQGDTLSSMSEGKKAFVILRILLDFNDNQCPILIDQPEDDLDNRAIYTELVQYLRNKKKERQIILVTHNPNVVVGADAEEIIVANQNGAKNENQEGVKFEYITGSLENLNNEEDEKTILLSQDIRQHVCDILEGGDIAFKKREKKYELR